MGKPGDNGYVVIVTSEPIRGLPSNRIYGPYPKAADGWAALGRELGIRTADDVNEAGFFGMGVLPIRDPADLSWERP